MALLIQNGEIVTESERYVADILCEGETISRIASKIDPPTGATVIDAAGKYVFPGFIDPHTHIYLPFMGTTARDDYESGTIAALVGGTTTIFDMCCPAKDQEPSEGLAIWKAQADGHAACDYSFHMGVTKFDETTAGQLRDIVAGGIRSFKVFLAYRGAFGVNDDELYRTLELARELGVITAVHCENETLVAETQQKLLAAGRRDPSAHHDSRPPVVEAAGVHHLMAFAELTKARVYIVHLSCKEALDEALRARDRGVDVTIETLIQYLILDKSFAERADFEGAKFVMSPPLRDKRNQPILWKALAEGEIATVATDHAPFDFDSQKRMGEQDFTKIPNGIPAIEDRINLLYTHGVAAGRIDLNTFVRIGSTNAAKTFGLFPKKGTVREGSDADLVVYDPAYRGEISARTHSSQVDYSAFEGFPILGRPVLVTLRGEIVVEEGCFVGQVGRGRLLLRDF